MKIHLPISFVIAVFVVSILTFDARGSSASTTNKMTFEGLTQFQEVNGEVQRELYLALEKSGSNRQELLKAIYTAPDPRSRADIIFLVCNMPERDLLQLSASFLLENTAYAEKARREFAWCRKLPQQVFLNEVLPYANLNERRDNWRADFYRRFRPLVINATNITDAIYSINRKINKIVKVEYSTKRKKADQSPYESIETGMASCTGLSILLCDAFRSVGIPARVAGTPCWTTKRGNHNWVEVFIDGKWHFTEYYPDAKGLDHSWLLADAGQANPANWQNRIYAASFAPTPVWFPLVWDLRIHFVCADDVTDRYIKLYQEREKEKQQGLVPLTVAAYDHKGGARVPIKISLRQGDRKIASGTTPGPRDDLNNMLIFHLQKQAAYTLEWSDTNGQRHTREVVGTNTKSKKIILYLNTANDR